MVGVLDDVTNGSQNFSLKGDLMQDSQAVGVKKRKVVTPVAVRLPIYSYVYPCCLVETKS